MGTQKDTRKVEDIARVCGYSKKQLRYCAVQSRCVVVGTQKDTRDIEWFGVAV